MARPYAAVAAALGWTEALVIDRIGALAAARDPDPGGGDRAAPGHGLGRQCDGGLAGARGADGGGGGGAGSPSRRDPVLSAPAPVPGVWPYGLFSMIHGRSRAQALQVLDTAAALPALAGAAPPRAVFHPLLQADRRAAAPEAA